MANEFLGLNSINVLKSYIDKQVSYVTGAVPVAIITAYAYSTSALTIPPVGGQITSENTIEYPSGWGSLNDVEGDLTKGSIYMSSCEFIAGIPSDNGWSKPIRITPIDDANRHMNVDYNNSKANTIVSDFISKKYYISNMNSDTEYVIDGSQFDSESDNMICRFANIGNGKMTVMFKDTTVINNDESHIEIDTSGAIEVIRLNNAFAIISRN